MSKQYTNEELFGVASRIFDRAITLVRQQEPDYHIIYVKSITIKENVAQIEHNCTCSGDGYGCYGHFIEVPINVLLNSQDFDQYYKEQERIKDLELWKHRLIEREKEVELILKNKQWRLDSAQKDVQFAKDKIRELELLKP